MQRILLVSLSVVFVTTHAWAYSGGTGDPNDPYQIATPEDLIDLGNDPCDYDKHFILTADLDLTGYSFDQAVIAPGGKDYFESRELVYFSGSFDGQSHVISHLTIESTSIYYVGLFGQLLNGAVVSNIGLEAVNISGDMYTGGLVGLNAGEILACYCNGDVKGGNYTGGLAGSNQGVIVSSSSVATVEGYRDCGGFVGSTPGAVISCYSMGSVRGSERVGGLAGMNSSGVIVSSYSTSLVTGNKSSVGGLLGKNYNGTIILSFWDIETSGISVSAGGTGLSTTEMQNVQTYVDAGWDLYNEANDGLHNFWLVQEGTYPCLAFLSGYSPVDPNGAGTQEDPYLLTDVNELGTLWCHSSAYWRLEKDLDLSGVSWNTTLVYHFTGCFDGNRHVIRNFNVRGAEDLGLFGICSKAMISNLGLEDVDVNGTGGYVGGLMGLSIDSTIESSYVTGTIHGGDDVGGLVGKNNNGMITSSYNAANVSADNFRAGGIIGHNYQGIVTSCYNTGSVNAKQIAGGLIGWNSNGSIAFSYSTGLVKAESDVSGLFGADIGRLNTSNFWDIETSEWTKSGSKGAMGLSTAEMQDINTFLNAGWDFIDETDNGTEDIWIMPEGDYPRFMWEFSDSNVMENDANELPL